MTEQIASDWLWWLANLIGWPIVAYLWLFKDASR